MMKIFISHTRKDNDLCDDIDRISSRVGIKSFRSEFETILHPAWKVIKEELNQSAALFLVIGRELVKNTDGNDKNWKFTQNWISFEVGIACQSGKDIWAICEEGVSMNFPVPYVNNYISGRFKDKNDSGFMILKGVLNDYINGEIFKYPFNKCKNHVAVICPDCKLEFNLFSVIPRSGTIRCPNCLRDMSFPSGHYLICEE
ncbi:MAG: hypothetical protein GX660_16390 [Clostridiaceae bacterium]|nr:hypothetical protein [Clostridiaceae bacterium]